MQPFGYFSQSFVAPIQIIGVPSVGSLDHAGLLFNNGNAHYEQGQLDLALRFYQQALEIYQRQAAGSLDHANSLVGIGIVYCEQGQLDLALRFYQQALEIRQRQAAGSLAHAASLGNIGNVYCQQGQLDLALRFHQQALEIDQRQAAGSPAHAASLHNIGSVYCEQGQLDLALSFYQQALEIHQRQAAGSPAHAASLHNIGIVYCQQGQLDLALRFYQQALEIYQRQAAGSPDHAASLGSIGNVYCQQGQLDLALRFYQQALEIYQRQAAGSLGHANSLVGIGSVYCKQGQLDLALRFHQQALEIRQRQAAGSPDHAASLGSIGNVYYQQGQLDLALRFYQQALEIHQRQAAGSPDHAASLNNIGSVYCKQGQLDLALNIFLECYKIQNNKLIATHPYLINTAYRIADCAYQIAKTNINIDPNKFKTQLDLAMQYCDIVISKDPKFKFGYYLKAQILQISNNIANSVKLSLDYYEKALALDPNYGDAKIGNVKLLSKLAEENFKNGNIASSKPLIDKIQNIVSIKLQPLNYDEEYLRNKTSEIRSIGDFGNIKIELPKTQYPSESKEYKDELMQILQRLDRLAHTQNDRITSHESRLTSIEQRLDILDGKILSLDDSMKIIDDNMKNIDKQINELKLLAQTQPQNQQYQILIEELMLDKNKFQSRQDLIKGFNQNHDLAEFYHNLLSQLSAVYIAAKVLESEKLISQKTEKFHKASQYLASLCEIIPIIGNVASQVLDYAGTLADSYQNAIDKENLLRITKICDSVHEFENIALRIAVEITNAKKPEIIKFKRSKIKVNWQDLLSTAISKDAEAAISLYLSKDSFQSSLFGKMQGNQIISYLTQETRTAENLRYTDPQGSGASLLRKESVIATKIIKEIDKIANDNMKSPSPSVSKNYKKQSSGEAKHAKVGCVSGCLLM